MKFSVVTIFPDMIRNYLEFGLIKRAIENKLIDVDVYNLRDFSKDKHNKVDDRPFGGGAGMVMMAQPLFDAVENIKKKSQGRVILFSAYGKILNQKKVKQLSGFEHLILVCGRYEGVDQRFIDEMVDEEISIGEYVLMGGEVAAEVLIESVSRMVDGVVSNRESIEKEIYYNNKNFSFPQYTQPREFRGLKVPEVLLSGNHKEIGEWRYKNRKKGGDNE